MAQSPRGGYQVQKEEESAAASGTLRADSAVASDAQEITAAWARYAEEVMRHTSEHCCPVNKRIDPIG